MPSESPSGPKGPSQGMVERLMAMAHELPGVLIEDGRLELRLGEREIALSGISLDTRALGNAEDQNIALEFKLRGASARLEAQLSEGDWPTGSIQIRGLQAEELFRLAELQPPAELAGTIDFDFSVARGEAGALVLGGGLVLNQIAFFQPKISQRRVSGVDMSLKGELRLDLNQDTLELSIDEARSGPLHAQAKISIEELRTDPWIEFVIWSDELACDAIPQGHPRWPTLDH